MTAELIIGKRYYLGHGKICAIYAGVSNQEEHQFINILFDSNIEVIKIKHDDMFYVGELKTAFDISPTFKSHIITKSSNPNEYNKLIGIIQAENDSK